MNMRPEEKKYEKRSIIHRYLFSFFRKKVTNDAFLKMSHLYLGFFNSARNPASHGKDQK